jgi:hypothetical protein
MSQSGETETLNTKIMVIKVPIYVEVSGLNQEDLPDLVVELSDLYCRIVRNYGFENKLLTAPFRKRIDPKVFSVKCLTREKALEILRTKV